MAARRTQAPAALLISLLLVFVVGLTQDALALLVQKPCCSAYAHAGARFGPRLPWVAPGVMGTLSRGQDKDCNGAVPNSVVMIDRGLESFIDAVKACQAKGVVAVVVRNVAAMGGGENDLVVMDAMERDNELTVPSIFVSRKTGDELDVFLAMNPTVFVELFAADDVNSIMAYLAYLVMSVEMLFFSVVFFTIVLIITTRRMARNRGTSWCRLRSCRRRTGNHDSRSAMLSNDSDLTEPLTTSSSNYTVMGGDPENKPPKDSAHVVHVFPIVLADGNSSRNQSVSIRVDSHNDEPVFEQQEQ